MRKPSTTPAADVRVRILADPAEFAAAAAPVIAADPVSTNVLGTVVASVMDGDSAPDARWILADRDGVVIAAAMRTPPFPLHLPAMPDGAVAAIARALSARGDVLPGVSGDVRATAAFVRHWGDLTGASGELAVNEGIHVLGELLPPSGIPGTARPAAVDDLGLIAEWLASFAVEVHGGHFPDPPPSRDAVARQIADGTLVIWEDAGRPVSLAGWRRPSAGLGRVGPVYTPAAHRRHGYAAGVTAAATLAVLAAGADGVMLYTDLANPTSNRVYARLGYRKAGEASEWTLTCP